MFGRYLWLCGCLAATLGWAAVANAQQYTLVSVSTAGTPGNRDSTGAVFSGDGKVVAFSSLATNLVPGDTNGTQDVFVRDLASHTTTRVSVASDGSESQGFSGKFASSYGANVGLNQDGAIVAFASTAALHPADTNGHLDIYVRDRTLNQTTRVSVASDGGQANDDSTDPHLSGDGRYVVFTSAASNLVSGDNNGFADVFLRDRTTLTTTRLSVSSTGGDLNASSVGGRISADGRIVVFVSAAALVSDPDPLPCTPTFQGAFRGSCIRAFVLDRSTGTITRVPLPASLSADGADVSAVDITADGRFVLIQAEHGQFSTISHLQTILAVYDRQTGRVEKDVDMLGLHPAGATISGNGRFLAVGIGGVAEAASTDGFTFDRQTSFLLTEAGTNYDRFFSPDGLAVLFSAGVRLVPEANGGYDIYLLNRDTDNDGMPDSWETQFGLNPNDPNDAALDSDGDGDTNLQEYLNATNPKGTFKRYFAEGAANGFFTTRLGLFNPGDQATTVVLEFLGQNSQTRSEIVTLAAHGWTAVTLGDPISVQPDDSFSTIIEADRQVIADRTMTWDKSGYGSHAETAIEAPGTTWYLAEGSTGGSFDLFYQLQNPGDTTANITVNYLRPSPLPPIVKTYTVAPRTRRTIYVDTEGAELAATDLSAKITADQPILAERAMYFSTPTQPFAAGHEGAAVAAPATSWFLAEGATGSFFDLFLLLANADTTDAQVKVTYLLPSGPPVIKHYTVAAQSRLTINVDAEDPQLLDTPVSTIVESTNSVPVVAERAMWWPSPNWYEAHLSAGSTTTGTKWALADGLVTNTAGSETETYIMIANTSASAGSADVTLFFADGTIKTNTFPLAANSRLNVQVSVDFPDAVGKGGFGTIIQSNGPQIVVERAIYSNANGQTWAAGSDALATRLQ